MKKTLATLAGVITLGAGGTVVADSQINPYRDVQIQRGGKPIAALQIQRDGALPEQGKSTVIVNTDTPRIELQKWNGEVALGVTYTGLPANTSGSRPLLSKNVEWGKGNPVAGLLGAVPAQTMEGVPIEATTTMEDGGYEINVILNEKPTSNVFTFQLDNWQNLDFFYQPALTQEEIDEGASRPDNVVDSYAVYYKNHANHIVGQTNYATGKAYHIYRPLVADANGVTTWADLSYSNGVLSVTVPQSFLDSAAYPVKVDPTFGYNSVGATEVSGLSNSTADSGAVWTPYTASSGDTITSYSVYLRCGNAGTGSVDIATYSISGGQLSSRLDSSIPRITFTNTSAAWATTTAFSLSMSTGTAYGLATGNYDVAGNCGAFNMSLYQDTGGASDRDVNSSSGALPSSWSHGSFANTRRSYYATYTAGGGGTTPVPTVKINGPVQVKGPIKI